MNRKYDVTFVAGTPLYAGELIASGFKHENGFIVFYLRDIPIAEYQASLVIGISSRAVD